ncbi:GAF domain-containing protein [Microbacterium sp. RD1]|uniref:GAF domain-containing protein n=1 Tax=Microbacterium sp. RD1 TaxID=3457313 RepID=UPI003FA5953B
MPEPRTFRAPMRSRRDDVDHAAAVERALTHGLVGVGGVVAAAPPTVADAAAHVAAVHGERMARRLERFAAVPAGVLVWTRDGDGLTWLGRLAGPWRYDDTAQARDLDLPHVRDCAWLDHPTDDEAVPPRVHLAFRRGGRNWQEIRDAAAATATATLWVAETTGSAGFSPG